MTHRASAGMTSMPLQLRPSEGPACQVRCVTFDHPFPLRWARQAFPSDMARQGRSLLCSIESGAHTYRRARQPEVSAAWFAALETTGVSLFAEDGWGASVFLVLLLFELSGCDRAEELCDMTETCDAKATS